MKKLFFIFLIVTSSSLHAEWKFIGSDSKGDKFFFDSERVKEIDGLRYSFELINYQKENNGVLSGLAYIKTDCKRKRAKILNLKFYSEPNGHGDILYEAGEGLWRYTQLDDLGATAIKMICELGDKEILPSLNK